MRSVAAISKLALTLFLVASSLPAQTRAVAVIAHRGEHRSHPENTVAAYRSAVELGADFFEVDVRTTQDAQLVLMHDDRVDRTTNGHGEVAKLTLAEIRRLDAGQGAQVPTLDEALDAAGRHGGVYLDCKNVDPKPLVEAIDRHRMHARVVVYGRPDFLRDVLRLKPELKVMAEAVAPQVLSDLVASLGLRVAAFDARDWNPATIAVARKAGIDLYVDRLGADDNAASWQAAVDSGATGIQTDHPGELVRFLRERGWHR